MGYFLASLSKSATSDWLDASEILLLVFAVVVVIGVVGEHRCAWPHPKAEFFALLVAIGCGGEFMADGGVFVFSRQLQTISDHEVKEAVRRAGGAEASAKNAAKDATRARVEADRSQKKADLIGRQADKLFEKTSKLQTQLEDSQAAELKARKEVSDLESSLLPRKLEVNLNDPIDKKSLEILKSFAGINVTMEAIVDVEARRAAYEIGVVIGSLSGWKITEGDWNSELWPWYFDGVTISYPLPPFVEPLNRPNETDPNKIPERAAMELGVFLMSKGWEAKLVADNKMKGHAIKITVGFKPNERYEPESRKEALRQYEKMEHDINEIERLHPPPLQ